MKNLEQTIRMVMEQQANAGVLEYGSDIARDTYAKDTPGQTPGIDHNPVQHQHKPELAMDGVPMPGGELKKPQFQKGIKDNGPVTPNNKLAEKKDGIKNCGCGKEPCETYGSKEEQMKAMNEAMKDKCGEGEYWCNKDQKCKPIPDGMKVDKDGILVKEESIDEAGRWDKTSTGRAYRRLSPEEKRRQAKKNELIRQARAMKGQGDYIDRSVPGKVGKGQLKSVYKGKQTRESVNENYIEDLWQAYLLEMTPSQRAYKDAARDAAKEYGKPKVDPADKDSDYKAPKKRGRGERDLPHIVSQMRSVLDNDKHPGVKFKDGTTKKVSQKHAAAYLKKHDSSKPADRLKMYSGHDSHKSFMSHVKEAVNEKDKKGLKKLAKGLKGSSAAHLDQMKKLEKMIQDHYIPEGSKPNNPKLWAAKKAQAKAKFDVYPSAYANGWAAKQYKKAGGTWRSESVEHDLNELSSKTLKNYIRKAASPVNKPSAINLASKGGYKLGKSDKYDLDAGEKEDRKAYNRGRGIQKAAKKLYSRTNESNDSMQRMADTWNDHADHPHPKVQKHIKKAEKAYNSQDHEGFYHHTQRAADHAYSLRQKKKTNEEKMAGQEYRTQMAKVKSKNPAIRKAISNIYDKKPGKDIDHPEVKAAKKYMRTEATYDQVLKHRYRSDDAPDNPQRSAYLGKVKKGPTKGMDTYKPIPGSSADSKKGKMAAIKKQLKRRPKQYGIDGKHDPLYPANQGDIQKKAARQKSKRFAGQYMDQKKGENLAGRVKKG